MYGAAPVQGLQPFQEEDGGLYAPEPYPQDVIAQLLARHAQRPAVAPAAPRLGFLDRLAMGLSQIQAPEGGSAGDSFGANLVTGAARGFAAPRLRSIGQGDQRRAAEFAQQQEQQKATLEARIKAAEQDWEQRNTSARDSAKRLAEWRHEKAKGESYITIGAEDAKVKPYLKRWIGKNMTPSQIKALAPAEPDAFTKYQVSNLDNQKQTRMQGAIGQLTDNIRQDPDVKDFVVVRDNYQRIREAAKSASGVGDLAVIFSFMRVLDPTSAVREGEFKNAQDAIGKIPALGNTPSRWLSGNRLTPEGRMGFLMAAQRLYQGKKRSHDSAMVQYRKQAQAMGIDPELVIRDYSAEPDQPSWFEQNAPGVK